MINIKKIVKILAVILTICMITTVFSACGKKEEAEGTNIANTQVSPEVPPTDEEMVEKAVVTYTNALFGINPEEGLKYVQEKTDPYIRLKMKIDMDLFDDLPEDIKSLEKVIVKNIEIKDNEAILTGDFFGFHVDGTNGYTANLVYLKKIDDNWYIVKTE